jgi:ubiquitin-protein ligase E3 C
MYPSGSQFAKEDEQLKQYEFLGRIIGKGLYSQVLLDTSFSKFFLSKWLGKRSFFNDLKYLDKDLYKGLIYLQQTPTTELDLNFTVMDQDGRNINLIPNGSNINVDSENRMKYIHLLSNYRLNIQIEKQCHAFFRGLADLIQPDWLKMFIEEELQILISGTQLPVDYFDMKNNTIYGGVYDALHPTVLMFWEVVSCFDDLQKSLLCKFVTSCTRYLCF